VLLLAAAGCQYAQFLPFLKRQEDLRPRGRSSTERGPAFAAARAMPAPNEGDWAAYNNTPDGTRWSPLSQISVTNVGGLRPMCTAHLGERAAMQSGPVVVGGTMYVTTATSTYAIDAATCARRWRHRYAYSPKPDYDLKVNRGVAYLTTADGPRLVRGANDGRVYELDARTGEEVWNVLAGDVRKGETFPAAPVAWQGLVFIGNAGGDNYGVTGRMMAFDARTGSRVWSFELVARADSATLTWPAESNRVPRAGGATWTSYTVDTTAGALYVSTGNATPDFLSAVRPGTLEYTYSVVVLDARTGAFRRSYRLLQTDFHDYDIAAAPLLVESTGKRPLVVAAGKDGHVYGVSRDDGAMVYRTEVTTISNATTPLSSTPTRFCPGVQGGVEWNGPAYSPLQHALFVNVIDWCTTVSITTPHELKNKLGIPWTGSDKLTQPFGKQDPKAAGSGWLTALDARTGAVTWRYHSPTPLVAGVTATAGGLVFTADLAGHVLAFDAATGAERFRYDAGEPVGGGVVSYAVGGKQFIAAAVGLDAPLSWQVKAKEARVVVLGLP
jgi:alcohol dehydrogenase (cytochrome c)